MTKRQTILATVVCWAAVLGFVGLSGWSIWNAEQLATLAQTTLLCGNAVIDPLILSLNYGAPAAGMGIAGLVMLARRGFASRWSAAIAMLLTLGCTASLAEYGRRFFTGSGFSASDLVWWLPPLEF